MSKRIDLFIREGSVETIYQDEVAGLLAEVAKQPSTSFVVRRASHVEPYTEEGTVYWEVDLSPVGGAVIRKSESGERFTRRQDALEFELRWLNQFYFRRHNHGKADFE